MARKKAKSAEKEMKQKITMFDKLGEQCAMCEKPFDKKSREQVTTWNVVVREKEKVVRLYCPQCWGDAIKIMEEIQDDLRIQSERRQSGSKPSQPK